MKGLLDTNFEQMYEFDRGFSKTLLRNKLKKHLGTPLFGDLLRYPCRPLEELLKQ